MHCSAVSPDDYEAISTFVRFNACETRSCVNVTIVDDLELEPDENFFHTLEMTPGLDSRIELNPTRGEIEIFDDDG